MSVEVEVYLDLVILLNFLVDLFLIIGTNRLSGYPPLWKKAIAAAALGGLYGGACLLPRFRFLGGTLWRLIFLGLISVIAFGWNRSALRRAVLFILLSMALGGIAACTGNRRIGGLIAASFGVCILCLLGFRCNAAGARYIPVEITYGGRHLSMTALFDTGNTLRDPVSGEGVLVVGADVAQELLGLTEQQLRKPIETMVGASIPGLRLIPYSAVGQPGAMLLAVRCDDVRIDKRQGSSLVAFAPEVLGKGDVYQALTGGII